MQRLILIMMVVATTFDYLSKGDSWGRFAVLPRQAAYLSELLGGIALLCVVFLGTQNRFRFVRPAYWFIFGGLLFTILAGVLLNRVEPGPMFAGIRTYLRAIPWFFIGAVAAFVEDDIRKQLRLMLAIALIQLPLAIEQRMHGFGGELGYVSLTGDATAGTFILSSVLSLFLICCLCVLVAFYLRKRVTKWQFALLFVALLTPTMINSTKGTLVFLPLGLLVTFLAAAETRHRIRAVFVACGLAVFGTAIYLPVYNYFAKPTNPGIIEFFTDPEVLERNLSQDVAVGTASEQSAGRLDAVLVPLEELSNHPASLLFGLGIGNASNSALGIHFVGEHYQKFSLFLRHAFATIVLELGLLGLVLVLMLFWCIWTDSRVVARRDVGIHGPLAAGMAGATAIIALSMVYKDLTGQISMSFLFWYFAGLVAAQRMRLAAAPR